MSSLLHYVLQFGTLMVIYAIMSICLDADECQIGNGDCAHTCTNQVGSYKCSCDDGYQLASNKHSCIGRIQLSIHF